MAQNHNIVDKDRLNPRPKGIFLKSSIFGAIITIPSLTAFFISWYILGDKINAAIVGVVVHFVALGFSLKIAKKLFKVNKPS
jgi:ABC-type uncharacterized transport system permease subunit